MRCLGVAIAVVIAAAIIAATKIAVTAAERGADLCVREAGKAVVQLRETTGVIENALLDANEIKGIVCKIPYLCD